MAKKEDKRRKKENRSETGYAKSTPAKSAKKDSSRQAMQLLPRYSLYTQERAEKDRTPKKSTFIESGELPSGYGSTNLTLIARDPYWIYAYWEVGQKSREYVRSRLGSEIDRAVYVLRMYDIAYVNFDGRNANSWFDIEVGDRANNWYVNLWRDNVTYCGELGMRTPDGRFYPIVRSRSVTAPRLNATGRTDLIWMEVKEDQPQKPPFIAVEAKSGKGKGAAAAAPAGRRIFLTEDDIRLYYSKLFPLLKLVISARRKNSDWPYDELLRQYLEGGKTLDEFLASGLPRSEFVKRILLGSSEEMVIKGGASEFAKGGASEKEEKKRKFFFEIGTELIVYGRTEPDAEVRLGDKNIKLRDDGTFTIRFALPEGNIPLDFIATSKDKHHRKRIKTAVERKKTESEES